MGLSCVLNHFQIKLSSRGQERSHICRQAIKMDRQEGHNRTLRVLVDQAPISSDSTFLFQKFSQPMGRHLIRIFFNVNEDGMSAN